MATARRRGIDPLDDAAPSFDQVRRAFGRVPAPRLIATGLLILLAVGLARFSWDLPLLRNAERMFYDTRALQAALYRPVEQDRRILLVTYTPETLRNTGRRSPLDRAILSDALANLDRLGARAIGIDILIDQPQPEDAQLLSTLRSMRTPSWLAYASNRHNMTDIEDWQQAYMDAFRLELGGTRAGSASIRLEADPDTVVRNWPERMRDLPPPLPLAMAGRADDPAYAGSIRYRMPADADSSVFLNLPIDLFASREGADRFADQVRGRFVLIGGDLPDIDRFVTPENLLADPDTPQGRQYRETIPGLEVHATMLAQLLDNALPTRLNQFGLWTLALLVVLAGAFTAMLDVRPWVLALVLLGQAVFFIAAPFVVQMAGTDTQGLPAFGWLAGWLLAFMATEAAVRALSSEQRRFAQSALGKYLPRDIAAQILREPGKLTLTGEKRPIFALFTDLEGFTHLSHRLPPEQVAPLLNAYLDGMCDIILNHGGTIDKFVGDAIVAMWGAPIAQPDDGERAATAMLAMLAFARDFSQKTEGGEGLGRTRAGLHYGEALVGNFGGKDRFQYTALGDVMNCASRLESANKLLKTSGLVSEEAMRRSGLDIMRPMGRIILSGRRTPLVVWEPAPSMPADDREQLGRLWEAYDSGDVTAVARMEAIAHRYPDDAALAQMVYRLRRSGPGGHFELREK